MKTSVVFLYMDKFRSSYWFIPTVMAIFSFFSAFLCIYIDQSFPVFDGLPFAAYTSAEGARSLLSVIAGSLITVASVAFSMTLLTLSHVSSRYGARVFPNLLRNTGDQFTLGIFTSTFIFSMLVLRTVRSKGDTTGLEFVPNVSILIAFILSLVCIGTLIFFFHHVPETMRLSEITKNLGQTFKSKIKAIHSEELEDGFKSAFPSTFEDPTSFISQYQETDFFEIKSERDGYIQNIDFDRLFELACEMNTEIHLLCTVGQFMCEGQAFLKGAPFQNHKKSFDKRFQSALTIGSSRTTVQDLLFPAEQLIEIAAKALSPGVNEPFTAMMCLDWLKAGLVELSKRKVANLSWRDKSQQVRLVLAQKTDFESVSIFVFNLLRDYVATDRVVTSHAMELLNDLALSVHQPVSRGVLHDLAKDLFERYKKIHQTTGNELPKFRGLKGG